jgi:hypothetical protein
MAWTKLDNPKPSNSSINPLVVKVVGRAMKVKGGAERRFAVIKMGSSLCDRARFISKEHRCHVMAGSAADAGKVAIAMDDQQGKFVAKRKADGRYEICLGEGAAAGKFSLTFPPFERPGSVQTIPGTSPIIIFEVTPDFLGVAA